MNTPGRKQTIPSPGESRVGKMGSTNITTILSLPETLQYKAAWKSSSTRKKSHRLTTSLANTLPNRIVPPSTAWTHHARGETLYHYYNKDNWRYTCLYCSFHAGLLPHKSEWQDEILAAVRPPNSVFDRKANQVQGIGVHTCDRHVCADFAAGGSASLWRKFRYRPFGIFDAGLGVDN